MKLISWNVNGIRAVHKKNMLMPLLEKHKPDFLFIQEIKGRAEQFGNELTHPENYRAHYNAAEKKGYAGTAVWVSKSIDPGEFVTDFPENPNSNEGRLSEYRFTKDNVKYAVLGVYFPNGGKSEQAWEEKLIFYDRFLDYTNDLRRNGFVCIWCGDVNCAHNEIDLARPKENDGAIGFHPREREWIDRVVEQNWHDIFRFKHPDMRDVYSWWHMITRARLRNIGWRIDYFFCDSTQIGNVNTIEYLTDYQGSDHCPLVLTIDAPGK